MTRGLCLATWQSMALVVSIGLGFGPSRAAPPNPNGIPGIPADEGLVVAAIEAIDGLAKDAMQKTGTPGVGIAVVHKGKTVFAKGYGVRKVGEPEMVDKDTVFQLASVSKPIGATVIAREIGNGTVAWDTPIVAHMPGFMLGDP